MNKNKLKAVMVENGDTGTSLALALGVSRGTLSLKLNEKNNSEFNTKEIKAIRSRYNLSAEQLDEIFFAQ